jgi:hypothetical protein
VTTFSVGQGEQPLEGNLAHLNSESYTIKFGSESRTVAGVYRDSPIRVKKP